MKASGNVIKIDNEKDELIRRSYLGKDVYEAARERVRWLYSEFDRLVVNFSGGKDSTVVLNLTLEAAEELGRLPVPVVFVDQEAEWDTVISYMREVMSDPRVEPYWFQMPIRISSATSQEDPWLWCWKEGDDWIREKEPNSIHENKIGSYNFEEALDLSIQQYIGSEGIAIITGVRAEESPARRMGLTSFATYKSVTWGNKKNKTFSFHPIWDWSYRDVWKAIQMNGWKYCELYDHFYRYGIPPMNMRVSSVHHETAVTALTQLQEIEPRLWNRVTDRMASTNSANQVFDTYRPPKVLPPMFKDWREYRDHLLARMIEKDDIREIYRKRFLQEDEEYVEGLQEAVWKMHVASLLVNDYHGTKSTTFRARHASDRKLKNGRNKRWGDEESMQVEKRFKGRQRGLND